MKRLKQLLQPNTVSSLHVNYTHDPIHCDAGEASVRYRWDLKETEREEDRPYDKAEQRQTLKLRLNLLCWARTHLEPRLSPRYRRANLAIKI